MVLLYVQRVAVLHPRGVVMPPPIQVPKELRSYYASLTLEPSDILSFAYQIASGMVSRDCVIVVYGILSVTTPCTP